MLLNKNNKSVCTDNCDYNGNCNCNNEIKSESTNTQKELLGSFDHKVPVLEISKNNYKVIKDNKTKNMLLS